MRPWRRRARDRRAAVPDRQLPLGVAGFAIGAWWIRQPFAPSTPAVAIVAALVAAMELMRPQRQPYAIALAGLLAGVWSAVLQLQGLPLPAALVVAVTLPAASAYLRTRRPAFAPAALREEALLFLVILGVVSAAAPGIAEGWRAAGTLNVHSERSRDVHDDGHADVDPGRRLGRPAHGRSVLPVESSLNVLQVLENGLFALGQVLRFPVMALLWVCVVAAIFMAGHVLVEFVGRRRERQGFNLHAWLKQGPALAEGERLRQLPSHLRQMLAAVEAEQQQGTLVNGAFEHLLLEREERVRRTLAPSRMLVKVGPSLGLLGTLIPMGTSLASLATGNLEAMAGQMVVAFTTTIIGLATGTLAYVVAATRQGWVNETIREQRFLAERIAHRARRRRRVH